MQRNWAEAGGANTYVSQADYIFKIFVHLCRNTEHCMKGAENKTASSKASLPSVVPDILAGAQACHLTEHQPSGKPESLPVEGFICHLLGFKLAPWESHPVSQIAHSRLTYGTFPERSLGKFHFLHLILFPLLF